MSTLFGEKKSFIPHYIEFTPTDTWYQSRFHKNK